MRPEEEWARQIVSRALDREVHLHDDGSSDGLYDLRVGPADAPEVALEVTGAVDPVWTETWNVGPGRGSVPWRLRGNWQVMVRSGARINALRATLEPILIGLEDRGVERADDPLRFASRDERELANEAGVQRVSCWQSDGGVTPRTRLGVASVDTVWTPEVARQR